MSTVVYYPGRDPRPWPGRDSPVSYASPREPWDDWPKVARAGSDGTALGACSERPRVRGERVNPKRVAIPSTRCRVHGNALRGLAREESLLPCPRCEPGQTGSARRVLVYWFDRRPGPAFPYAASYGQELAWLLPEA